MSCRYLRHRSLLGPAVLLLLVLLALQAGTAQAADSGFRNPVVPETNSGGDTPDPWLFISDGRYWLTYTAPGAAHVELRSATTLDGLADARPKRLWPRAGQTAPAEQCCAMWAPEIHRLKGPNGTRWYVYYSATGADEGTAHRMYVLESTTSSPAGPYVFKGRLDVPQAWAIDATVGVVGGRLYLLYAGGDSFAPTSIYIAPLSDPWTVAGAPLEISSPTLPWETSIFAINEGPELLPHGNKLNVIYSAAWCGSGNYALGRLTVPRTADLLAPATWASAKSPQPVLKSSPANQVYGPGHGSFFTSPDGRESWNVYHATEQPKKGCFTGGLRTTRAQRFSWNADDTPNFGTPVAVTTDIAAPGGDGTIAVQAESRSVFRAESTRSKVVRDRRMFGYQGVRLVPRSGALARVSVRAPRSGRYSVRVRVLAAANAGTVTLRAGGGRTVSRRAVRSKAQMIELDFGVRRLERGRNVLRLSGNRAISVDQLRVRAVR